jgi:probable HAF family extracellular repeat protein
MADSMTHPRPQVPAARPRAPHGRPERPAAAALAGSLAVALTLTLTLGAGHVLSNPVAGQPLTTAQAARAVSYEVIVIRLPGLYVGQARINPRGTVAGTAHWPLGGAAFIWDERGGMTLLQGPDTPWGPSSYITDLNAAGRAIGHLSETGWVTWGPGNRMNRIATPDGWMAELSAINVSGTIAGAAYTPEGLAFVLRRPNGEFLQSPPLDAFNRLVVTGVSATGLVVGTAHDALGRSRALAWRQGSPFIDLGVLPGDLDSAATAVDNRGTVIGTSHHPTTGRRAFRWTERDGMVHLPGLGEPPFDWALGIDHSGNIYGSSNGRAVMWTARNDPVDLTALADLPPGMTLTHALGADARGRILAVDTTRQDWHGSTAVLLVPRR